MTDKQASRWAIRRSKGFGEYVLKVGILQAGTFYALGMFFTNYYFANEPVVWSDYLLTARTWFLLIFHWLFFGFFMGMFLWIVDEWCFGKYMRNNSEPSEEY